MENNSFVTMAVRGDWTLLVKVPSADVAEVKRKWDFDEEIHVIDLDKMLEEKFEDDEDFSEKIAQVKQAYCKLLPVDVSTAPTPSDIEWVDYAERDGSEYVLMLDEEGYPMY